MAALVILAAPFLLVGWTVDYANRHPWLWVLLAALSIAALSQVPRVLRERKRKADLLFSTARPSTMGPIEYERYCAEVLRRDGWQTEMTPVSGDQGVDVVARLQGVKAVLQCKRYTRPVGNKAVQEILAGKVYYGAQIAAVVSTAPYTPSAHALAQKCGVLLLGHGDLPRLKQSLPQPAGRRQP